MKNPFKSLKSLFGGSNKSGKQTQSLVRIIMVSPESEAAINNFYQMFRDYVTANFNAQEDELYLDPNCVGATARFMAQNVDIQVRLWESSEGYKGIPDMTSILYELDFNGEYAQGREFEVEILIDLARIAKAIGFRYFANLHCPASDSPRQVPGCEIACVPI